MGNGLLTDVSSTEDTTGASNADGPFDSGAPAAPFAAQPQNEKAKQKKKRLENGMRKRRRHGGRQSSLCAWKETTHLGATGRAGMAAAGGSGDVGASPRHATRRRAASLPPPPPLLLLSPPSAFGPRLDDTSTTRKKKSDEALNKIYLQNFL